MLLQTISRLRRAGGPLLAAGASALALAACGADPDGGGAASSDNDRDTARLRLEQCLRENGVELPAGPGRSSASGERGPQTVRVDRDDVEKAMEGPCKTYRAAAFGNISDEQRQEMQDAFQKFAQCMRDNGVELPDITKSDNGRPQVRMRFDADDPDERAAREKCQKKLPRGGSGGPGAVVFGSGAR